MKLIIKLYKTYKLKRIYTLSLIIQMKTHMIHLHIINRKYLFIYRHMHKYTNAQTYKCINASTYTLFLFILNNYSVLKMYQQCNTYKNTQTFYSIRSISFSLSLTLYYNNDKQISYMSHMSKFMVLNKLYYICSDFNLIKKGLSYALKLMIRQITICL